MTLPERPRDVIGILGFVRTASEILVGRLIAVENCEHHRRRRWLRVKRVKLLNSSSANLRRVVDRFAVGLAIDPFHQPLQNFAGADFEERASAFGEQPAD